jgi:FkbM family methyltransferase
VIHEPRFKYPSEPEQEMVRAFFGDKPGFFVDVGANHPTQDSQSYHLEQHGWDGQLIEPEPACAAALRKARKAQVVECACSSPANAGKTMTLNVAGAGAVYSTLEAAPAALGARQSHAVSVSVDTLDNILRTHCPGRTIDLLSLDVEGHELEVLEGIDLHTWRPRLVLLEDHVVNLAKHRKMRALGFRLLRRTGVNSWYIPQDIPVTMSLRARLEMIRKYYLGLPFRKLRYARA